MAVYHCRVRRVLTFEYDVISESDPPDNQVRYDEQGKHVNEVVSDLYSWYIQGGGPLVPNFDDGQLVNSFVEAKHFRLIGE